MPRSGVLAGGLVAGRRLSMGESGVLRQLGCVVLVALLQPHLELVWIQVEWRLFPRPACGCEENSFPKVEWDVEHIFDENL